MKIHAITLVLCFLGAGAVFPEPASVRQVTEQQNSIYRSFRSHLNMGKTVEAAKLYVAGEFGVEPDAAMEEYFTVKFYRMRPDWKMFVENKIREALRPINIQNNDLADFLIAENQASFSYTGGAAPLPDQKALLKETAYLIAGAVFEGVPEIEQLRISIGPARPEGAPPPEHFDFINQL